MSIDTGIDHDLNTVEASTECDTSHPIDQAALLACEEKLVKSEERYKYLNADFENFKRNTAKERAHWMQTAQDGVLKDILLIVDDFDRASVELGQSEGFELIRRSLTKLLEKYEITETPATGTFDPNKHEALMRVASEGVAAGTIVQVYQKGYMRKGVILRTAQVSVAS